MKGTTAYGRAKATPAWRLVMEGDTLGRDRSLLFSGPVPRAQRHLSVGIWDCWPWGVTFRIWLGHDATPHPPKLGGTAHNATINRSEAIYKPRRQDGNFQSSMTRTHTHTADSHSNRTLAHVTSWFRPWRPFPSREETGEQGAGVVEGNPGGS